MFKRKRLVGKWKLFKIILDTLFKFNRFMRLIDRIFRRRSLGYGPHPQDHNPIAVNHPEKAEWDLYLVQAIETS